MAAASVVMIGALFLSTWLRADPLSRGEIFRGVSMKANTAMSVLACGAALGLLCANRRRWWTTGPAIVLAVAVIVLGALTLSEHLVGWNLGIDELLFRDRPLDPPSATPGRPCPPASSAFILCGTALLLLDFTTPKGRAPAQYLAAAGLLLAMLALVGYVYDSVPLYGIAKYTAMALPTAAAMALMGLGLLMARPERGLVSRVCADDLGGMMARRLLLPAAAVPLLVGWLRMLGQRMGFYDTAFGTALAVLVLVVALAAVVWWNAGTLSRLAAGRAKVVEELRSVTTYARCILWHSEVTGLPGWERDPEGKWNCIQWNTTVQDEHAAQQVLPLDIAEGSTYQKAWRASQDEVDNFEMDRVAARALHNGERSYVQEFRCRDKFGNTRWLREDVSVQTMAPGRWRCFGVATDITARKIAEQERDLLLVREKEARVHAETQSRRKDQFLAVLSHELRTPLTPVVIHMDLLEREPNLSPEMRSGLDMIRRNVELEARLIDDLLDMTRITRGKVQLNLKVVDAHDRLKHAVEIYRSEIVAKRLDLTLELTALRRHVRADSQRLQQVFWNLVGNAVKFTPPGGSVMIRTSDEPGGRLRVRVSDTGIGIEPGLTGRIFEPFEQGEHAVTRRFGGLGLGLSITKALVELHGGTIAASSPGPDRGATFTVEFDALEAPPLEPVRPRREGADSANAKQGKPPLRILLVEDNADTLRAMSRLLRLEGHQVATANSAGAAMTMADEQGFDLLISDVGLPDATGWELMRALRARGPVKGIALSGYSMEEDTQKSREAGFTEHLAKPIDPAALEVAIQRVAMHAGGDQK